MYLYFLQRTEKIIRFLAPSELMLLCECMAYYVLNRDLYSSIYRGSFTPP